LNARARAESKEIPHLTALGRTVGLWVNKEFFRNLHKRAPQTAVLGEMSDAHNRYLELVDPLGISKPPLKKVT
jgi:hypothetical protein